MKVQQQNSYNPSMKAVYFTQGQPLFNKAANYINRSGKKVMTTPNGTRYFEDLAITSKLKEKFENVTFIKKLAEKNEVFIQYFGEKYNSVCKDYQSMVTIRIPNYEKYIVMDYNVFERDTRNTNEAQAKMFQSVENKNWFRVTKFENGKSIDIVDPIKKADKEFEEEMAKLADKYPIIFGFLGLFDGIINSIEKVGNWGYNLVDKIRGKV